jgi:hypothetical protein
VVQLRVDAAHFLTLWWRFRLLRRARLVANLVIIAAATPASASSMSPSLHHVPLGVRDRAAHPLSAEAFPLPLASVQEPHAARKRLLELARRIQFQEREVDVQVSGVIAAQRRRRAQDEQRQRLIRELREGISQADLDAARRFLEQAGAGGMGLQLRLGTAHSSHNGRSARFMGGAGQGLQLAGFASGAGSFASGGFNSAFGAGLLAPGGGSSVGSPQAPPQLASSSELAGHAAALVASLLGQPANNPGGDAGGGGSSGETDLEVQLRMTQEAVLDIGRRVLTRGVEVVAERDPRLFACATGASGTSDCGCAPVLALTLRFVQVQHLRLFNWVAVELRRCATLSEKRNGSLRPGLSNPLTGAQDHRLGDGASDSASAVDAASTSNGHGHVPILASTMRLAQLADPTVGGHRGVVAMTEAIERLLLLDRRGPYQQQQTGGDHLLRRSASLPATSSGLLCSQCRPLLDATLMRHLRTQRLLLFVRDRVRWRTHWKKQRILATGAVTLLEEIQFEYAAACAGHCPRCSPVLRYAIVLMDRQRFGPRVSAATARGGGFDAAMCAEDAETFLARLGRWMRVLCAHCVVHRGEPLLRRALMRLEAQAFGRCILLPTQRREELAALSPDDAARRLVWIWRAHVWRTRRAFDRSVATPLYNRDDSRYVPVNLSSGRTDRGGSTLSTVSQQRLRLLPGGRVRVAPFNSSGTPPLVSIDQGSISLDQSATLEPGTAANPPVPVALKLRPANASVRVNVLIRRGNAARVFGRFARCDEVCAIARSMLALRQRRSPLLLTRRRVWGYLDLMCTACREAHREDLERDSVGMRAVLWFRDRFTARRRGMLQRRAAVLRGECARCGPILSALGERLRARFAGLVAAIQCAMLRIEEDARARWVHARLEPAKHEAARMALALDGNAAAPLLTRMVAALHQHRVHLVAKVREMEASRRESVPRTPGATASPVGAANRLRPLGVEPLQAVESHVVAAPDAALPPAIAAIARRGFRYGDNPAAALAVVTRATRDRDAAAAREAAHVLEQLRVTYQDGGADSASGIEIATLISSLGTGPTAGSASDAVLAAASGAAATMRGDGWLGLGADDLDINSRSGAGDGSPTTPAARAALDAQRMAAAAADVAAFATLQTGLSATMQSHAVAAQALLIKYRLRREPLNVVLQRARRAAREIMEAARLVALAAESPVGGTTLAVEQWSSFVSCLCPRCTLVGRSMALDHYRLIASAFPPWLTQVLHA